VTKPGRDADGLAQTEADHYEKCPGCRKWFDLRDLKQVLEHLHDGWDEIEINEEPAHRRAVQH
jgi:hypothetical protein